MWGQLRQLKIRGDWEKFKYKGAYKIKSFGGLKNRGGKAFRGPVTEGCLKLAEILETGVSYIL